MALIQKAFSDIITFSRTSNATRVGPTGVLEYAPHNLLTYSQDFSNAAWDKGSGFTLTANAIAAPDGTVTADLFTRGSTGLFAYLAQVITGNANQSITFSCWVRTVSGSSTISLTISDYSLATLSSADLSIDTTWRRLSFTVNAGQLSNTTYIGVGFLMGAGQSAYFWGAQLAVGPYALDYVPTTSAAVYGPRFDYDGSGVAIVEPVSTNLLLYSQEFDNAAWTKVDCTASANATTSPDGTVTADQITEVLNTSNNLFNATAFANSAGQAMSASVFLKYLSRRYVQVVCGGAADGFGCVVDLVGKTITATGTKGSSTYSSSTITELFNGWVRVTINGILASSNTGFLALRSSDASTWPATTLPVITGQNAYYLWGAQLEVGSTATAYMVSGASNGFRAVPVVSGSATPKGLLVEEQRQNLFTYSEQFDNAAWAKGGSGVTQTVTANAGAAPDGTVTADQVTLSRSNASTDYSYLIQAVTLASTAVHAAAVYMKAATSGDVGKQVALWQYDGTVKNVALITLTADWQRYSPLTTSTLTSGAGREPLAIGYRTTAEGGGTQTGSVSFLLWGAQAELGSFSTSYIPTLASAVTRSADVASVNTLSPWMNQTEGTIFAEYSFYGADAAFNNTAVMLTDGTENNYEALFGYTPAYGWVQSGGATSAGLTTGGATAINTNYKSALAFKANDFAFSINGASPATDTSGTVPTVTEMLLGRRVASSKPLHGHLRRVAFFPRRLSNAELQALTA